MCVESLNQGILGFKITRELVKQFGSNVFTKSTIQQWVSSLKSPNKSLARKKLGYKFIYFWDEVKRASRVRCQSPKKSYKQKSKQVQKCDLKREYLDYISKCVRSNKIKDEIVKDLVDKHGRECFKVRTIENWIWALKSSDREKAKRMLTKQFISYWDVIDRSSQDRSNQSKSSRFSLSSQSIQDQNRSKVSQARSKKLAHFVEIRTERINEFDMKPIKTEAIEDLPDIIEIKQESDETSPDLIPTTSSRHSSRSMLNKEPKRILGKATLNGQIYFMIKWKGKFEDELGM